MKKICGLLIAFVMVVTGFETALAGGGGQAASGSDVSVTLNGQKLEFDQAPIIKEGRTLVPMRKIFEALGYDVEWDDGTITVYDDGDVIMILWIDDYEMLVADENGDLKSVELDVPPQIVNERTLVPVRAISDSVGADVDWNNSSRTVIIKFYEKETNEHVQERCRHNDTEVVCVIDFRKYQPKDEESHWMIETMEEICDDCGETVDSYTEKYERPHNFKNGFCSACGAEEKKKISTPSPGGLDIEDDGSFKTVTLQSTEGFTVTNIGDGNLSLRIDGKDGKYSYVQYNKDGNAAARYMVSVNGYHNITVKKGETVGVYNHGDVEITVKAPSNVFFPTDREEAFVITPLVPGASCSYVNSTNNSVKLGFYCGDEKKCKNGKYDYVMYDEDNEVKATKYSVSERGYHGLTLKKGYSASISNSGDSTIYIFCPYRVADFD